MTNLDDLYEVEPASLEDLYDLKASPLESEYDLSSAPSLEDQYDLSGGRKLPMPKPPTPAENFNEVAGQVGEVSKLVGKMAVPAVAGAAASAVIPPLAPTIAGTLATGALGGVAGGAITRGVGNLMEGRDLGEGSTFGQVALDATMGAAGNYVAPWLVGGRGTAANVARGVIGGEALGAASDWLSGHQPTVTDLVTRAVVGGGTGAAVPVMGRAAGRLADSLPNRTDPVSTLPGYDESLTLRAPLVPVEPMPAMMHDNPGEAVSVGRMSPLQAGRSWVSSPKFVLNRTQNTQAGQIAGRRLHGLGQEIRMTEALANRALAHAGLENLPADVRQAVTVAQAGRFDELPQHLQTEQVRNAARTLSDELYGGAADRLTRAGAQTLPAGGDQPVDFTPRDNYVPWMPHPDEEPSGLRRIAQLLSRIARPPQTLHERTGTRGPDVQALEDLHGIVGPRNTNWDTDARSIARRYISGDTGRVGLPELVARSSQLGPITERRPDMAHPWGRDANILYQEMQRANAPFEAELWRDALDPIYRKEPSRDRDRVLSDVSQGISHLLLGQTASTQVNQGGAPVWRFGLANDLRGKYDWLRDPSYRELGSASGALNTGFANEMGDVQSISRRLTEPVERTLRGFGNAGLKPYLEGLVERVQSGNVSLATRKQIEELGLTVGELQGGMTGDLLSRAFEQSAHRNQHHPYAIGESGPAFTSPVGKLFTKFQPFGHAQARVFQEDVLEPLFGPETWRTAIRNRDLSVQRLGLARAARLPVTVLPAALASEGLKSIGGMRDFSFGRALDSMAGATGGTPFSLLSAATQGYDPNQQLFMSPALALGSTWWKDIQHGDPQNVAYDIGALRDPTGWASFFRPTFRNLFQEERKHR